MGGGVKSGDADADANQRGLLHLKKEKEKEKEKEEEEEKRGPECLATSQTALMRQVLRL